MTKLLVITDLDGTLLDHDNYDFRPALPAIRLLRERGVPLVFCSSKTAAEILELRRQTNNRDPFIVENGGAIYLPAGGFERIPPEAESRHDFHVLRLGRTCTELELFLADFCQRNGLSPRLFTRMTPAQLSAEAGLSEAEAARSLDREFDLPFKLTVTPSLLQELERESRCHGFRLVAGGRYLHLTGDTGKGEAAKLLKRVYATEWGSPTIAVGLGDSRNDLDLLLAVEMPIIVPNPASGAPLSDLLPEARTAPEPGPAGWNAAVLSVLAGFAEK